MTRTQAVLDFLEDTLDGIPTPNVERPGLVTAPDLAGAVLLDVLAATYPTVEPDEAARLLIATLMTHDHRWDQLRAARIEANPAVQA